MMSNKYKKIFWWGMLQMLLVAVLLVSGVAAGEDSQAVQWYGEIVGVDTVKGQDVLYVGDSMFFLERSFGLVVCGQRTESSVNGIKKYIGRKSQIVEKEIDERSYAVVVIVECNK